MTARQRPRRRKVSRNLRLQWPTMWLLFCTVMYIDRLAMKCGEGGCSWMQQTGILSDRSLHLRLNQARHRTTKTKYLSLIYSQGVEGIGNPWDHPAALNLRMRWRCQRWSTQLRSWTVPRNCQALGLHLYSRQSLWWIQPMYDNSVRAGAHITCVLGRSRCTASQLHRFPPIPCELSVFFPILTLSFSRKTESACGHITENEPCIGWPSLRCSVWNAVADR